MLRGVLIAILSFTAFAAQGQQTESVTSLPLVADQHKLYADSYVQDSIPARLFLEAGVQFPLIDSTLVWSHPDAFEITALERPVRFNMAGGTHYVARYKIASGIQIGATHSLRETFVVDMSGRKLFDVLYPLNHFTTDSVAEPGIFELDIRGGFFRPLTTEELPVSGSGWDVYDLARDEKSGMYSVPANVRLADAKGNYRTENMDLVLDLGNANLLALFAFRPHVKKFVARAPVENVTGKTPNGTEFRVLTPAVTTFMDRYRFRDMHIVVLDKQMTLPGDGFLGVRFFGAFRVIFDFRHDRLWLLSHE